MGLGKKKLELDVNKACMDAAWGAEGCSHSCHSQGEWVGSAAGVDEGSTDPWKQLQQPLEWKSHICDFQCLLKIPGDLLWRCQPGCPHWGCCFLLGVKPEYVGNISSIICTSPKNGKYLSANDPFFVFVFGLQIYKFNLY